MIWFCYHNYLHTLCSMFWHQISLKLSHTCGYFLINEINNYRVLIDYGLIMIKGIKTKQSFVNIYHPKVNNYNL